MGVVNLATNIKTLDKVAVKDINLKACNKRELLLMEVRVMRDLKHPNLVNLVDTYLEEVKEVMKPTRKNLYVVMEVMEGGALTDVAKYTVMPTNIIAMVCKEVIKGISYLHKQNVVHRDIKVRDPMKYAFFLV